jgi:hypothetical protein
MNFKFTMAVMAELIKIPNSIRELKKIHAQECRPTVHARNLIVVVVELEFIGMNWPKFWSCRAPW